MPRKGQRGGHNPGAFKPGNKIAVGNGGASRPNFLTQTLISMLNEVDKNTGKEKLYEVCDVLFKCAVGGVIYYYDEKTKKMVREVLRPEGWAMKELWDRVQGKAAQMVGFDPETNQLTLIFDKEDEDA